MIVVDTNVVAYLWIQGAHTGLAERTLRRDAAWAAPLLWRSEFHNILAGYLRRRVISLDHALELAAEAQSQLRGHEYSVATTALLQLVADSPCSAYDCEFVALAMDLGVPLVTSDRQILKAFPQVAVSPRDFVA